MQAIAKKIIVATMNIMNVRNDSCIVSIAQLKEVLKFKLPFLIIDAIKKIGKATIT